MQMICSAQRRVLRVTAVSSTLHHHSSASGVWRSGAQGGFILMCPFFWADGARGNTDVLVGAL